MKEIYKRYNEQKQKNFSKYAPFNSAIDNYINAINKKREIVYILPDKELQKVCNEIAQSIAKAFN